MGSCMIVGTVRSKRNPSMHGKWPNAFSSLSSSIFRGGHILHYWGCYGTLLHCEIFLSGLVRLSANITYSPYYYKVFTSMIILFTLWMPKWGIHVSFHQAFFVAAISYIIGAAMAHCCISKFSYLVW